MPVGATLTITPLDHRAWSESFARYADWYTSAHPDGKNLATLFQEQTLKLAYELFQDTAAVAPSESEIAADVQAQGWKIPTRFGDGRLGRGTREQWANTAAKAEAKRVRGGRRGRPPKGESRHDFYPALLANRDGAANLAMMQAFVIRNREHARGYVASGWLGAIADLGGSPKASSGAVDHDRGGADQRGLETVFWNRTPGIESVEARYHVAEVAALARAADMGDYFRRKAAEAQAEYFSGRAAA